jgi:putative phosphoserine phosphatase/1-acylglycerol-3-phosphate O-acyltransferase
MPRGTWVLRPGVVDVVVLPPVSVKGWEPSTMAPRIEEVRQQFIATLESWPGEAAEVTT